MPPIELLNRWIVPLEKRYDFLTLSSGKKVRVPFDQLILFSTNLEPKQLVDEAFLRRIPYKIKLHEPTVAEYRRIFDGVSRATGLVREKWVSFLNVVGMLLLTMATLDHWYRLFVALPSLPRTPSSAFRRSRTACRRRSCSATTGTYCRGTFSEI